MAGGEVTDPDDWWKVKVFRDDPVWDAHEKWWMVPMHRINELFVCEYEVCTGSRPTEERSAIKAIRQKHPGCVLVY